MEWKKYLTKPETVDAAKVQTTRSVQTSDGEKLADAGDFLVRRGGHLEHVKRGVFGNLFTEKAPEPARPKPAAATSTGAKTRRQK